MTNQQPGTDGRDRDPVGEFFARHRAQVRDEPADDLTWHRIRETRHRARSGRRGAWTGALVAAAAAIAIVVGPSLLPAVEEPDVAGPVPSVTGPATSPTDDPGRPSSTNPTPEPVEEPRVVTATVPEGLPAAGRFADVTTADPGPGTDTGVRYAVVMHPCDTSGWCTVLGVSEDGGSTWAPRADLEELGMVHRVLFTDHGRGWVWGDKAPLWTTTDGGATWTEVPIEGDAVEQVAVREDVLLAVTTTYEPGACVSGDCPAGSRHVVLTDPTDTDWRDNGFQDLGAVEVAEILGAGDTLYVVARQDSNGPVSRVLRLQDGQLEPTAALTDCAGGPAAITASDQDPNHLWALCDDQRGLALHETDNGARTWSPAHQTVPSFVLGEQAPLLASTTADHLLLIGEGNYTVTTDGGQTWSEETFLPGATSRPERVEVTMSGEVIAYPTQEQADAGVAAWRSGDGGVTWETVDLP